MIRKISLWLLVGLFFACAPSEDQSSETETASDASDTSADQQNEKITEPEVTEVWEPEPEVVAPVLDQSPPSDAIVLFDGKDLSAFQQPQQKDEGTTVEAVEERVNALKADYQGEAIEWDLENGELVVNPKTGSIETRQSFGSVQLHIEWLAPVDEGKEGQGYSNSGVFLMGMYEVQILNSYENRTYSNGQAGAVYKQHIPLVNASRPPGNWQAYDIVFDAPVFAEDGSLEKPAFLTVFHNGVLIQNHVELEGPTVYIAKSRYFAHPKKLPLRLQDHGNRVRYRNIWLREL